MKRVSFLFIVLVMMAGCSPKVHHVGKPVAEQEIQQVQVGVHTKRDVAGILGSPTFYSLFKEDRWYYAFKVAETTAFLKPVATEQDTYVIVFNENGIVKEVKHLGMEDAKEISYVSRETPTTGQDSSMLKQLFGNFGRITRSDKVNP